MDLSRRLNAFAELGKQIEHKLHNGKLEDVIEKSRLRNKWFIHDNTRMALEAITKEYLEETKLKKWAGRYNIKDKHPQKVAIIMAGNIPLAGFHDLLCTLLAGHKAIIKMSSKDDTLLPAILDNLFEIDKEFKERVETVEMLDDFDAVIATGSNNTGRYFEYYFGRYPGIIRKNRNSAALLTGDEQKEELRELGRDIFSYFGLGCRNVSKIFVPENYDFNTLFESFERYHDIIEHSKYMNNYDYNKSIFLLNRQVHLDTGFLLVEEVEDNLASPMATLYYETYSDMSKVIDKLKANREQIQCIVCRDKPDNDLPFVPPGYTQYPALDDYADGIDTMKFLTEELSNIKA